MSTAYLRVNAIPLTFYAARAGTRVAALFTAEQGQVRVGVRTSTQKGSSKNLPIALFSSYELLLEKRARAGDLFDLKETESAVRRPNLGAGKPIAGWAAASVLAELLLKTTEPHDPQPYLYAMFTKALDQLDTDQPPAPLMIAFLLKYLEHMGLGFQLDSVQSAPLRGKSYWMDVGSGELHGNPNMDPRIDRGGTSIMPPVRVSLETLSALRNFRVAVFERLRETPLSQDSADEAVRLMETWLEHHLDTRLKSFTFWREVNDRERNRT